MGVRSRARQVGLWQRTASRAFYWAFNRVSNVPIEPGAPEFFMLSRRAREALQRMPEQRRFLRGMVAWMGFSRALVPYVPPARAAGESKYTLARMLSFASDALYAFSSAPLRLLSLFGTFLLLGGLTLGAVSLARALFELPLPTPLWVSALVLFALGVQLLGLGMVGGYVARTFEASRGRPMYLVKQAPDDRAAEPRVLPARGPRRISHS